MMRKVITIQIHNQFLAEVVYRGELKLKSVWGTQKWWDVTDGEELEVNVFSFRAKSEVRLQPADPP